MEPPPILNVKNLTMGYCCLNTEMRKQKIFTSRTCRLATLKQKGLEYAYSLAHKNLCDLRAIIEWNYKNNIFLFRMSSEMFPFASHPEYYADFDLEQYSEDLQEIGLLAKGYNQRLTFHPGQYNQLTSKRQSVVDKTIVDIDLHSKIMDMMGLGESGVIVIHGGGKQDGKQKALDRFRDNFRGLSESSRRRIVLENCEMCYSVQDLLPLCKELSIPLVLDYHHYNINPGDTSNILDLSKQVLCTWKIRGIVPLFHLSESREGVIPTDSITKRRAHSDYVKLLPDALLYLLQDHEIHLDIEAKMKEKAVIQLKETYLIK